LFFLHQLILAGMLYLCHPNSFTMKVDSTQSFSCQVSSDFLEFLSERAVCATRITAFLDLVSRRVPVQTEVSHNNHPFVLQPGQAMSSLVELADLWKWDRKKVRRFIERLEELGYIRTTNAMYGTIFEFPFLDGTPNSSTECPTQTVPDGSPKIDAKSTSNLAVLPVSDSVAQSIPDFRYCAVPLVLDEHTRMLCRQVYDRFASLLPRLDLPPYSPRTEKAIYNVFVLGMKEDMSVMEQFLNLVAADPYMNGDIAEMTGCSTDKESFTSLFSCKWQELLFPEKS